MRSRRRRSRTSSSGSSEHVKAYERLTIAAALSGDDEDAFRALLANPLVPGAEAAEQLRDALIEANLPYLPRFVAAGRSAR